MRGGLRSDQWYLLAAWMRGHRDELEWLPDELIAGRARRWMPADYWIGQGVGLGRDWNAWAGGLAFAQAEHVAELARLMRRTRQRETINA